MLNFQNQVSADWKTPRKINTQTASSSRQKRLAPLTTDPSTLTPFTTKVAPLHMRSGTSLDFATSGVMIKTPAREATTLMILLINPEAPADVPVTHATPAK